MELKEQYKQEHSAALAVAEKMAASLAPLGASAQLKPEVGVGGGGVGVGFTSPYITFEVSADGKPVESKEGQLVQKLIAQGTTAEKGVAHAVAEVLNVHLGAAQPVHAGRLARADGNSINVNLDALSTALRNNPKLEGVLENLGGVVQQTVLGQFAKAQEAAKEAAQQPVDPTKPEQVPVKKNPIGFQPNEANNRWTDAVKAGRAQQESQGHSR